VWERRNPKAIKLKDEESLVKGSRMEEASMIARRKLVGSIASIVKNRKVEEVSIIYLRGRIMKGRKMEYWNLVVVL
jgi:hypothetical protein